MEGNEGMYVCTHTLLSQAVLQKLWEEHEGREALTSCSAWPSVT